MCAFDWYQNHRPWATLNDLERQKCTLFAEKMRLLEPTAQIWIKIDPHNLPQKCSTMILVSRNIRFMGIFAGVSISGGVKLMRVGLSTTAIFGHLNGDLFRIFRDKASNIILCLKKSMWRYLFDHNSNTNCPIIIIFGTVVTESISYWISISFFHLTYFVQHHYLGNHTTWKFC